jgi:secretory phospholipase A2
MPPGAGVNFKACCDAHDVCYGTCLSDKTNCDNQFGRCLISLCATSANPWTCKMWAADYVSAVQRLGSLFFTPNSQKCICVPLPRRCPIGTVVA